MAQLPTDTSHTLARWGGRVLTALPALMLLMSASMKLSHEPQMLDHFVKLGYARDTITALGVVELLCMALYLIPRTTFLGAILLTGYLGGAIAHHVRIGEGFAVPLLLGVLVWGGIYLRDSRLQALLPLRRSPPVQA